MMGDGSLPKGLESAVLEVEDDIKTDIEVVPGLKALAVAYRRTRRSRLKVVREMDALFNEKRVSEGKLRMIAKMKNNAVCGMRNKPYMKEASAAPRSTAVNVSVQVFHRVTKGLRAQCS